MMNLHCYSTVFNEMFYPFKEKEIKYGILCIMIPRTKGPRKMPKWCKFIILGPDCHEEVLG